MLASEILHEAFEILRGGYKGDMGKLVFWSPWCQGVFFKATGECCLLGAVHCAAYDDEVLSYADPAKEEAKKNACYFLGEVIAPGSQFEVDIVRWNDDPKRTLDQVLGVLAAAKALALEAGQ